MKKEVMSLVGKLKVWFERGRMWIGIIQFVMVFYLFVLQRPENPWLISLGVVLLIMFFIFLDVKYIMPNELSWCWKYNPEYLKLKEVADDTKGEVEELKKMLKILIEERDKA